MIGFNQMLEEQNNYMVTMDICLCTNQKTEKQHNQIYLRLVT